MTSSVKWRHNWVFQIGQNWFFLDSTQIVHAHSESGMEHVFLRTFFNFVLSYISMFSMRILYSTAGRKISVGHRTWPTETRSCPTEISCSRSFCPTSKLHMIFQHYLYVRPEIKMSDWKLRLSDMMSDQQKKIFSALL